MSIGMVHRTGVRQPALALAVVVLFGVVSLVVFFIVGGPFGFINNPRQCAVGVLSAVLAWRSLAAGAPRLERLAAAAASFGAIIMIIGSVLIIFDFTGWYLAGPGVIPGRRLHRAMVVGQATVARHHRRAAHGCSSARAGRGNRRAVGGAGCSGSTGRHRRSSSRTLVRPSRAGQLARHLPPLSSLVPATGQTATPAGLDLTLITGRPGPVRPSAFGTSLIRLRKRKDHSSGGAAVELGVAGSG